MTTELYLGKPDLKTRLNDSRLLVAQYMAANREDPRHHYHHGTADQVALNMLEREHGIFVVSATPHGGDVKLKAAKAHVMADGTVVPINGTVDCLLEGVDSETIRRFAAAICDVVDYRFDRGNSQIKSLMPHTVKSDTARTRRELAKYQ